MRRVSLLAQPPTPPTQRPDRRLVRQRNRDRVLRWNVGAHAPSALGSFLRSIEFGHVRQIDAVASRFLTGLAAETPNLLPDSDEYTFVDIDDTIIEVEGYLKQGASFGYSGVRGLNAVLATASTRKNALVILPSSARVLALGKRAVGAADAFSRVERTGHEGPEALARPKPIDGLAPEKSESSRPHR